MKILIIEDDLIGRIEILDSLCDYLHLEIILSNTLANASKMLIENKIDLIITEIKFGDDDIFRLLDHSKFYSIPILFITHCASQEFFNVSKKFNNTIYLIKPIHRISIMSCVEKLLPIAKQNEENGRKKLVVKGNYNEKILLDAHQVEFVKSELNYSLIKTSSMQFTIKCSLINIIEILGNDIIQIHKSYLVNKRHILGINLSSNKIKTKNAVLPIGRAYRINILNHLATTKIF